MAPPRRAKAFDALPGREMTTTKAAPSAAKTPASLEGRRTAYLVLGMHRSGTSAMTQLLALAGANLPQNVMPGDEHNAKGYFEPWKIAIFDDERLRAAGTAWDDVFVFPFRALSAGDEGEWLERAKQLFREEYRDLRYPLLKDPRVSILTPLWRRALDEMDIGARCVIPVRDPLAVAGSLSRRNGFPVEKSVLLWSAYMLAAEAHTRDLPRAFVSYDALLADWRGQVGRIETAHGAPLPKLDVAASAKIDRFLTQDLRHNTGGEDLAKLGWAGELAASVHAWFQAAASDAEADPAPLEAAARELARRRDEVGVLVSPVTRDLDATRADLLAARQLLEFQQRRMDADRAELEAGWRADVERLQMQLDVVRRDASEAARRLDSILADG
jgi:hypothetical protein